MHDAAEPSEREREAEIAKATPSMVKPSLPLSGRPGDTTALDPNLVPVDKELIEWEMAGVTDDSDADEAKVEEAQEAKNTVPEWKETAMDHTNDEVGPLNSSIWDFAVMVMTFIDLPVACRRSPS